MVLLTVLTLLPYTSCTVHLEKKSNVLIVVLSCVLQPQAPPPLSGSAGRGDTRVRGCQPCTPARWPERKQVTMEMLHCHYHGGDSWPQRRRKCAAKPMKRISSIICMYEARQCEATSCDKLRQVAATTRAATTWHCDLPARG